MSVGQVSVDIPSPTWEKFVKATDKQKRSAREVLEQLIQSYTEDTQQGERGFYDQLTRRSLQGALSRTGSINTLRLSDEVATAVQAAFGTSDTVELIEQVRSRL